MWIFVVFWILSLNISQTEEIGNDQSTQMYYAVLVIDEMALNVTKDRLNFSLFESDLTITDFKMTTRCVKDNDGMKTCSCEEGHIWTDKKCKNGSSESGSCSLEESSALTCFTDQRVGVSGQIKIENAKEYQNCLVDKTTPEYNNCRSGMLDEMKTVYSKLRGFDTLTINKFSIGSLVVDFAFEVATKVSSDDLIAKSVELSSKLNASMELETSGIVTLTVPKGALKYNNSAIMNCSTSEQLNATPQWKLKKADGVYNITNGTISTIKNPTTKESALSLLAANELWEGEYICLFVQKSESTIIYHKDNKTMDICLLPKITSRTIPQFPKCNKNEDVLLVEVICEVEKSIENYVVSWTNSATKLKNADTEETQVYRAQQVIDCGSKDVSGSCIFVNECEQSKAEQIKFNIIRKGDKFCSAEGDWDITKAGFTAEIKCSNQAGTRFRKCSNSVSDSLEGKWEEEVSKCVNKDLSDVLKHAVISDVGLGELVSNVGDVLSNFQNVTRTVKLDTSANIETSVKVLDTLQGKEFTLDNQTTIKNFLDSSSHLLNETLGPLWTDTTSEFSEYNSSMAEKYMKAVERLIEKSNIYEKSRRENVQVDVCTHDNCTASVFNVNVSLKGGKNIKTAGFQSLDKYLPDNRSDVETNSIVVTVTAEIENSSKVTIDFPLFKKRPRNIEIHCVYWDSKSQIWNDEECEWGGPFKEERCICNHLSSFAILMSKEPLVVPGLDYVTYAGLGVSIVSLIISLAIELIVWSDVVKTNTLYLRHTAHVNISLCLLIADICFLASSNPKQISDLWCRTSVVVKHFCYLAMFFWMLCLSSTLLHQAVFLFHKVSRKNYLRFSLVVGYVCPMLIVFITFLTNQGGQEGMYYNKDTCWLVYRGLFQGTIFTFILPMGAIVFINIFSMLVVILKLVGHHSEIYQDRDPPQVREKAAAKTVVRSVVLLTPVFGVPWIFGLAVMIVDLTSGDIAYVFNYIFVLLNAFQGLFIFLTTCLGDKMTREALLKRFRKKGPPPSEVSESTTNTKLDQPCKK